MKLNNSALMKSAGIGVAINVLIQLCFGAVGFAPLAGPDVFAAVAIVASFVGILACLCGGLIAIGVGFAYVYFAKSDGPVQMTDGAIGGGIANGIAGLVGGLLSACLGLVTPLTLTAAAGASPDIATVIAAGIGGAIGALCGGLFVGAIFGAIGGLIGSATVGKAS